MTNDMKEGILTALYAALPYVEDAMVGDNFTNSHEVSVLRNLHKAIALLEDGND